jgi:hypothetical protein
MRGSCRSWKSMMVSRTICVPESTCSKQTATSTCRKSRNSKLNSMPRERLWTLPKLQMSSLRRDWRRLHICLSLRPSRRKHRFLNLPSPRNLGVRGRRGCLSTAFQLLALCIKRVCLNITKAKNQDHTAKEPYKTTSTTPSVTQNGRPLSESLSSATPHATASTSASS